MRDKEKAEALAKVVAYLKKERGYARFLSMPYVTWKRVGGYDLEGSEKGGGFVLIADGLVEYVWGPK